MTQSAIRWEKDADNIVTLTLDDPNQSANTMNELYTKSMAETVARLQAEKADIKISQDSGAIIQMDAAPQLSDLVRMLNGLGATPQDLLAILQAIKAAGAMNAELEVI